MCFNTFPWMQIKDINGDPVDNPKLALVEAICISYFTVEFLIRLAGSPDKLQFLKGTMNVVDCLAIAPYYLDLFFAPPPELDPEAVKVAGEAGDEEDEKMFSDMGRIMQGLGSLQRLKHKGDYYLGTENSADDEDIQTCKKISGSPVNGSYSQDQLEGCLLQ